MKAFPLRAKEACREDSRRCIRRGVHVIKDNQTYFNRLHVLLDALIIIVSYVLAWLIMIHFFVRGQRGTLPVQTYMLALVFIVPLFLLLPA